MKGQKYQKDAWTHSTIITHYQSWISNKNWVKIYLNRQLLFDWGSSSYIHDCVHQIYFVVVVSISRTVWWYCVKCILFCIQIFCKRHMYNLVSPAASVLSDSVSIIGAHVRILQWCSYNRNQTKICLVFP